MKSRGEIEEQIAVLIEDVSLGGKRAAEVRSNDRVIADLGLDSLDYATIMLNCERWLQITVQEEGTDWSQIQTVEQLARFLHRQQRP